MIKSFQHEGLRINLGLHHMPMKNPPHPGRIIRQECLEPLSLTVVAAADALGVTRNTLTNLLTGKNGVSPEMAIRLSQVFGSTAETWLKLQMQYDLAQALESADKIRLKRIEPTPPAAALLPA